MHVRASGWPCPGLGRVLPPPRAIEAPNVGSLGRRASQPTCRRLLRLEGQEPGRARRREMIDWWTPDRACSALWLRPRATRIRRTAPPIRARTRCRFGLKRRFVATMECDRLLPVDGFFPQMAQTLDMRPSSVPVAVGFPTTERHRAAAARSWEKRSAISSALRTASAPFSIRGSACSTRSSVSTPNETGTPVSSAASWRPLAASLAT